MFKVAVRRTTNWLAMKAIQHLASGPKNVKVGLPKGKADGDVVEYAFYNEFGTRRIPERPFMRIAMREHRGKYRRGLQAEAKAILRGQTSLSGTLNRLGALAAGDIQDTISSSLPPPNAPSTVRQKGSSGTLIDEGRMRQSITWKVEND